jgi:hypothetical protein
MEPEGSLPSSLDSTFLSQINPIRTFQLCVFKNNFTVIFLTTLTYSKFISLYNTQPKFCIHFSFLSYMRLKNPGENEPVERYGCAVSSVLNAKVFNSKRIKIIVINVLSWAYVNLAMRYL